MHGGPFSFVLVTSDDVRWDGVAASLPPEPWSCISNFQRHLGWNWWDGDCRFGNTSVASAHLNCRAFPKFFAKKIPKFCENISPMCQRAASSRSYWLFWTLPISARLAESSVTDATERAQRSLSKLRHQVSTYCGDIVTSSGCYPWSCLTRTRRRTTSITARAATQPL